jgi:hypothetical protein
MSPNTNLQDKNNEIWIGDDLDGLSMNPINKAGNENETILNIELEERKLAIYERQVKLRREKAEVEAMELRNRQLRMSLDLTSQ